MSALSDYLLGLNVVVAPTAQFSGVLVEGAGPPDANTSPFFMFYRDTATEDIYYNPTRSSDGWEIALAGSYLDAGEERLKVSV